MDRLPLTELLLQHVKPLIPYALRIEHQTGLENIPSQHQIFLARCLKHLTENRRQEGSSLRISLGLYVT